MFAAEFEPAQRGTRRRSPRAPVSLDAHLGRGGLERALCKVVDVSIHGCRLQTYTAMKKGSTIWLTLPRIGQVVADVMWADDFTAGCQFQKPLTERQFADLTETEV
jgi:hypothetical protein